MASRKTIAHSVSQPIIITKPDGYYFTWAHGTEANLCIAVTRIKEDERRSAIEAEIEVGVQDEGDIIAHIRTNLLSLSARDSLVRSIDKCCITDELIYYPWQAIIHQVCTYTIRELRKGEPVLMLSAEHGAKRPEFLLPPLFIKNAANIIYADQSSAKSLFMTLVDIVMSLPWYDNNLGFHINSSDKHKVLFLDWENDANIAGWNKECLIRGLDLEWCDLPYLHCSRPLADSVDHIREKITEIGCDVVIIDSLGMAVGDDLNLTKPAFLFWAALRQLPVTPIIIAHTSKDVNNRRKTVYGNAYYQNEARTIWEISKDQQPNTPELTITLHHRKAAPFLGFHDPIGFRFIFNANKTMVEPATPQTDKRESTEERTVEDKIMGVLMKSDISLSASEILSKSKEPIKEGSIRVTLKRMVNKKDSDIGQDKDGKYYYLP